MTAVISQWQPWSVSDSRVPSVTNVVSQWQVWSASDKGDQPITAMLSQWQLWSVSDSCDQPVTEKQLSAKRCDWSVKDVATNPPPPPITSPGKQTARRGKKRYESVAIAAPLIPSSIFEDLGERRATPKHCRAQKGFCRCHGNLAATVRLSWLRNLFLPLQ